jgi:hypothetical protein
VKCKNTRRGEKKREVPKAGESQIETKATYLKEIISEHGGKDREEVSQQLERKEFYFFFG